MSSQSRQRRRLARIEALQADVPPGAVRADVEVLLSINGPGLSSTWCGTTVTASGLVSLPEYYVDRPFVCCDCGAKAVWTARRQKWWYERARRRRTTVVPSDPQANRRCASAAADVRRKHT